MALIEDRRGRGDGGYSRLFGDSEIGELISRVHAAVISAGTELEHRIKKEVKQVESLDDFLNQEIMPDGVLMASKEQIKKSKKIDFAGSEPDFVIFRRQNKNQRCHLVELKDGDTFDTKKAAAERRSMHSFISQNAQHLPYTVSSHFCCFNQDSREAIVLGFKNKITKEEAMTGREFCDLLGIDYDKIVNARKVDQSANLKYFVNQLTNVEAVRKLLNYTERT